MLHGYNPLLTSNLWLLWAISGMTHDLPIGQLIALVLDLDGERGEALLREIDHLRIQAYEAGANGQPQIELGLHVEYGATPIVDVLLARAGKSRDKKFIGWS